MLSQLQVWLGLGLAHVGLQADCLLHWHQESHSRHHAVGLVPRSHGFLLLLITITLTCSVLYWTICWST